MSKKRSSLKIMKSALKILDIENQHWNQHWNQHDAKPNRVSISKKIKNNKQYTAEYKWIILDEETVL